MKESAPEVIPRTTARRVALKSGETFAVFHPSGEVRPDGGGIQGIFHAGTRHLSRFSIRLGGAPPRPLSSSITEDNLLFVADGADPGGVLHLFHNRFLRPGASYEEIRVSSYDSAPRRLTLGIAFDADFADLFEFRGTAAGWERSVERAVEGNEAVFRYLGRDGVLRTTRVAFDPQPETLAPGEARYRMVVSKERPAAVRIMMRFGAGSEVRPVPAREEAFRAAQEDLARAKEADAELYTSNELFNDWLRVSRNDLHMLFTETGHGPYPYAGIPWYSTPFGRDGILSALFYLWINPAPARAVLRFLAETQADRDDPAVDAEPGKILHEAREGELVAVGAVPFARYYGSVDATPLFVVLAGAYYERTGDRGTLDAIRPAVERALAWIECHGDADGDGFVEYRRRAGRGLRNQAWKDSEDAYMHADGTLAEGPIASCEVQGYVYAARRAAARLFDLWGDPARAAAEAEAAERLRTRFEERFWVEAMGMYALGLDGAKRPLAVRSSNAGQLLWTGIASPERAARVAAALFEEDLFSGWGIRTLSAREVRYNPMSYHNGSVWPHDNALIAMGLARYGFMEEVLRLLGALFDASLFVEYRRMPELFCGFPRRPQQGPTRYPTACTPQAWAAASVFPLLGAALGVSVEGAAGRVVLRNPRLPPFLERVEIRRLRAGAGEADLALTRHPSDVGVEVTRRAGSIEILVVK